MPRLAVLALSLLVLVLGGGCGGDDEDAGGGEGGPAATTAASEGGAGGALTGSVGPGFEISVDGADGLTAGSYTLHVSDLSSAHNFHLTGPGDVDVATSVGGEGEESFEVMLAAGEYTFLCDPHASQMRGTFTVG